MAKLVVDASFLISAIRSCDVNHQQCFQFFSEHENVTWIIPTIAYFEYQAAQSRLRREGKEAYRELYIPNFKVYELTHDFIKQVAEMDLPNLFEHLKGADLVYACVAKVEKIPLVTCDGHFEQYFAEIEVVNPTKK
jgi:predicted nucleic acid-binding protein